jgi:protein-disulfide isomerase
MTAHQQGRLQPPVSDEDHSAGPLDAPVTLVEYGDFQCPYCFRAHPIVLKLQERLGDKLRFVFRNFPIAELHQHAVEAAQAAESVGSRAGAEAYWRMHHLIFEHQQDAKDALDRPHLLEYAAAAGANGADVEADLEAAAFEERVQRDFMTGVRSGVNGTPTFFINGVRYDGKWTSPSEFKDALEAAAAELRESV